MNKTENRTNIASILILERAKNIRLLLFFESVSNSHRNSFIIIK